MPLGIGIGLSPLVRNGSLLSLTPEYKAVLAKMIDKPVAELKVLQNNFAKTLVDAGIWAQGDMLLVSDNHTNNNGEAEINWINPDTKAINHGATHYPFYGLTPDGASTYVDSGLNMSTGTHKYTKDNCTILAYSRKQIYDHNGAYIAAGSISVKHSGQYAPTGWLNASVNHVMPNAVNNGFIAQTRNSSTVQNGYDNTTKFTSNTTTTSIPNKNILVCGGVSLSTGILCNNNAPISVFFLGGYLNDTQIGIFRDAIKTYINAVDKFKLLTSPVATIDASTKQIIHIPTNIEAFPGNEEVVHPSIVNCGVLWNGYQYWMAITPYPNNNDAYENPSIYCSSDGITWINPAGISNPIIPKPATSHNADTNLILDDNTLYCTYCDGSDNKIKITSSSDGITWSAPVILIGASNSYSISSIICPSIVKVGSTYYLYHIGSIVSNANNWINKISRWSATSITGPYTDIKDVHFERVDNLDWNHNSVRYHNGRYYLMAATTIRTVNTEGDFIYIGVSDDGLHFKRTDTPLITKTITAEGALYLPSFALIGDQTYVYYSAVRGTPSGWKLIRAKMDILQ